MDVGIKEHPALINVKMYVYWKMIDVTININWMSLYVEIKLKSSFDRYGNKYISKGKRCRN